MSRIITFSAALDLLKAAYEANCIGRLANGDYIVCHENGWFGRDSFELAGELCEDVNGIDTLRKAIADKEIEPPILDKLYMGDVNIDFSTETEYGEPQAWLYIENGESVEITYEKNGLRPSEYFYSIRRHCNEKDYENDVYHKTMGVIESYNCDDIQALIEIVEFVMKNSITRAEEKKQKARNDMYSETDKHCRECQCAWCDLRATSNCLEGENLCDRCDNQTHTGSCWWSNEESEE